MALSSSRAAWTRYAMAQGLASLQDDQKRPAKYAAKPVTVDGLRFDSRREARRYHELELLCRAGAITELELQPVFPIRVEGPQGLIQVGIYTADFRYRDQASGQLVIEDVKSPPTRTTAYRLRKRLVEAIYGIRITEV